MCWKAENNAPCWKSCVTDVENFRENLTTEKVIKIAAIVLTFCILFALVLGLMDQFPGASGAFYGIIGTVGVASAIALIIASVKNCQEKPTEYVDAVERFLHEEGQDVSGSAGANQES